MFVMKKIFFLFSISFIIVLGFTGFKNNGTIKNETGVVKITFINTVKGNDRSLSYRHYYHTTHIRSIAGEQDCHY